MKTLEWLGSSKKDLLKFPEEVRQEIGYALYVAQKGGTHKSAKLFKRHGAGLIPIPPQDAKFRVSACEKLRRSD